jgi:hypothetical protein
LKKDIFFDGRVMTLLVVQNGLAWRLVLSALLLPMIAMRAGPAVLIAVMVTLPASEAFPCGFEDPESVSIERTALGIDYPGSLDVLSEVERARQAGILPEDTRTDVQRRLFGFRNALLRLNRLAEGLGVAADGEALPAFQVVLLTPMLWSTLAERSGKISVRPHQMGPALNGSFVVTDDVVLEAMDKGLVTVQTARTAGLIRFYGPAAVQLGEVFDRLSTRNPDQLGLAGDAGTKTAP